MIQSSTGHSSLPEVRSKLRSVITVRLSWWSYSLQWVLDKQDLLKERQKDLKFLSEEEYWKLQIFFANGTASCVLKQIFLIKYMINLNLSATTV